MDAIFNRILIRSYKNKPADLDVLFGYPRKIHAQQNHFDSARIHEIK